MNLRLVFRQLGILCKVRHASLYGIEWRRRGISMLKHFLDFQRPIGDRNWVIDLSWQSTYKVRISLFLRNLSSILFIYPSIYQSFHTNRSYYQSINHFTKVQDKEETIHWIIVWSWFLLRQVYAYIACS